MAEINDWKEVPIDDWQEVPLDSQKPTMTQKNGKVYMDVGGQPSPGLTDWATRVLPNRIIANAKGIYEATKDPLSMITSLPQAGLQIGSGLVAKGVQALYPDVSLTPQGQQNVQAAQPIVNAVSDPLGTAAKIPRAAYEYSPDILAMLLPGPKGLRGLGMEKTANVLATPARWAEKGMQKIGTLVDQAEARSVPIKAIDSQIDKTIKTQLAQSIRPEVKGKRSLTGQNRYFDDGVEAVKTTVKDKDNLTLIDRDGNQVTGKLPETLNEMSQAVDAGMTNAFSTYDRIAQAAGERGATTALDSARAELRKLATEKGHTNDVRRYAQQQLEWLENEVAEGGLTPKQSQRILTELNQKTKAYWANPTAETATSSAIDNMVANLIREDTDKAVSSLAGEGWKEFRQQYGSFRALQDDVNRRALVDARKNVKGFFDLSDMWTAADVVGAIGNPLRLGEAGARVIAKKYIKMLNDPNHIVKQMFQNTEKLMQKRDAVAAFQEAMKGGQIPTGAKALPSYNPPTTNAWNATSLGSISTGTMTPEEIAAAQARMQMGLQPPPVGASGFVPVGSQALVPTGLTRTLFPRVDPWPVTSERLSITERRIKPAQASPGVLKKK